MTAMPNTTSKPLDVHAEIARLTDLELHRWLTAGGREKPTVTAEGVVQVFQPLTAAEMRCILERIKSLKIQSPLGVGSAADDLVSAAQARGLKFTGTLPPLSEEDDDATGD